jgi:YheO-like PAS domain
MTGPRRDARVDATFAALRPVVDMLGHMFGSTSEIVLHDLRDLDASIVAIANGHVSGRGLGGPVIGGPQDDKGLAEVRMPCASPGASLTRWSRTTRPIRGMDALCGHRA